MVPPEGGKSALFSYMVHLWETTFCCSMQVLFDTLKYHGASFTAPFWARVFDSVLLPIFDHVRAEVGYLSCSPLNTPSLTLPEGVQAA